MNVYTFDNLHSLALGEVASMVDAKKLKRPLVTRMEVQVSNNGAVLQVYFRAISQDNQLGEFSCGVTL